MLEPDFDPQPTASRRDRLRRDAGGLGAGLDERTLHGAGANRSDQRGYGLFLSYSSDGCARKRTSISTFLLNSRGHCQGSCASWSTTRCIRGSTSRTPGA